MLYSRLKEARESRGLTQIELGERANMSSKQIWRYEKGESDPTSEVLLRLAKALEVSMDWLVGLVDKPTDVFDDQALTAEEWQLVNAWRARDKLGVIEFVVLHFPPENPADLPDLIDRGREFVKNK